MRRRWRETSEATRGIALKLAAFVLVGTIAFVLVVFSFARIPQHLGWGRMEVALEMRDASGLYPRANVLYRGVEVGRVRHVEMTPSGARATLLLDREARIPADPTAYVGAMSAVGELIVDLVPETPGVAAAPGSGPAPASPAAEPTGPFLADGDVIGADRVRPPVPVAETVDMLEATLDSVGPERLTTLVDESARAVGGAGDDLAASVDALTGLAREMGRDREQWASLLRRSAPLLEAQAASSADLREWAGATNRVAAEVAAADPALRGVIEGAPAAAAETILLFRELSPTWPLLLANLVTVEQVAAVYTPSLEQILVLFPAIMDSTQSAALPNAGDAMPAQNTFFVNSYNDPPPCTTGFLPPEQRRSPTELDVPDTPPDLYCKVPEDSPVAVRGARNMPCMEYPGLRAATVALCREKAGAAGVAMVAAPRTYDPGTGAYPTGPPAVGDAGVSVLDRPTGPVDVGDLLSPP
ncbi:MlaD family protein [Dietzia sp. CH92]|uniref:MlaD family protein n=1 Tax=Dietzia sp. CH92 TaxID=3051823 RepID=UPI0028D551ED|nr:MlaD family protein [Dietzia sp. CH92]